MKFAMVSNVSIDSTSVDAQKSTIVMQLNLIVNLIVVVGANFGQL